MFCCTRKESHAGQIVTGLCLEQQCIRNKNQLACVQCIRQQHEGHNITPLKKMIPELLEVNNKKQKLDRRLKQLKQYVCQQFGEETDQGEETTNENIVQRVVTLLGKLRTELQLNSQQLGKMRSIFKSLNKNNQESVLKKIKTPQPQKIVTDIRGNQESNSKKNKMAQTQRMQSDVVGKGKISAIQLPTISPQKSKLSMVSQRKSPSLIKSKLLLSTPSSLSTFPGSVDTFSNNSKHPYLTISADQRTVYRTSLQGNRFAAVGSKPLTPGQNQFKIHIDSSKSGNIMIGLCHQSIVRNNQFMNNYGISNGTYLIGQNSNAQTAICFHHSLPFLNRKQIVGWNFAQGSTVLIGIDFQQQYIYFRRLQPQSQQFTMKLYGQDPKSQLGTLLQQGLRMVVLLQAEGDQISTIR